MIDTFCAASLNNMIYYPLDKNVFIDYSSNELLKFRNEVRNFYENIIVGANTIKNDNPTLLNENQTNKYSWANEHPLFVILITFGSFFLILFIVMLIYKRFR